MDVDVGGTPEPEGGADETARDEEGVAIVQQLERGLPRWPGLGEQGWTWEAPPEKWVDVVLAIKGHKDAVYVPFFASISSMGTLTRDVSGNRLAPVLENIPDNADIPYLSFNVCSLHCIQSPAYGVLACYEASSFVESHRGKPQLRLMCTGSNYDSATRSRSGFCVIKSLRS